MRGRNGVERAKTRAVMPRRHMNLWQTEKREILCVIDTHTNAQKKANEKLMAKQTDDILSAEQLQDKTLSDKVSSVLFSNEGEEVK